jgi:glyoxylase-like metal-dependent hydrolase (beta-lactamase superfamily II)
LTAPERREALLIDAPGGIWELAAPILEAENCRLIELWLTHGHWDHTQGGAAAIRASGAAVRAHRADRPLIETPSIMGVFLMPGMELEPIRVDHWVAQGDRLRILGTEAEVRHVPGHCPGNILFYFSSAGWGFVGDALFRGGIGRTDLPGGDFATLETSIRDQIYSLPGKTIVYPGHGEPTTVEEEREHNPFVSG